MAQQFPLSTTPIKAAEAEATLERAWRTAQPGRLMRSDVLRLLLALWDLETNQGQSMHNNNWGNVVAVGNDDFFVGEDSGHVRHFAAYATALDGAVAFIRQMTRDSRPQWRDALFTGDPTLFVRALGGKDGGPKYFEARLRRYLSAFLTRWKRYPHLPAVVGQRARDTIAGVFFSPEALGCYG